MTCQCTDLLTNGGYAVITPLQKRTLNGHLYLRNPGIEALLASLADITRDELVARSRIRDRTDPLYVPSECLLHFVRASRHDNSDAHFERLYKILAERVYRALPKALSRDGKTESMKHADIRDKAFDRFQELLALDRNTYVTKLDYFEVRFDGALVSLRRDAQEQVWRAENRHQPLEIDEDTGELSPEVEKAAGSFDPLDISNLDDPAYRLRLEAAIDALPPEQSRIIHMLRKDIPIDSKDPNVFTIAKALGRSEKTVRTYRDKAYAALRIAMRQGEDL